MLKAFKGAYLSRIPNLEEPGAPVEDCKAISVSRLQTWALEYAVPMGASAILSNAFFCELPRAKVVLYYQQLTPSKYIGAVICSAELRSELPRIRVWGSVRSIKLSELHVAAWFFEATSHVTDLLSLKDIGLGTAQKESIFIFYVIYNV